MNPILGDRFDPYMQEPKLSKMEDIEEEPEF